MIPAFPRAETQEVFVKDSLQTTRAGNAAPRLTRLVFAAILAGSIAISCGPQAVSQSNGSVVGTWRTILPAGTITIRFEANGSYNQLSVTKSGTQEAQDGPYWLVAPNSIIFRVTDWSPKTKMVLVPCGIPGDPVCNVQREQVNPKPPDSEYTYRFNGPNTMILNNQTGTITFTRVP